MRVRDLKQSRFLTQADVEKPVLVTIDGCEEMNMSKDGAEPDYRWTIKFRELEKPMVLNSTNGQLIEMITGSDNSDDWIGKKIVLFVDPTIFFGNKPVGGIRCRAPKGQAIPAVEKAKSNQVLKTAQAKAGLDTTKYNAPDTDPSIVDEPGADDCPF